MHCRIGRKCSTLSYHLNEKFAYVRMVCVRADVRLVQGTTYKTDSVTIKKFISK